MSVHTVIKVPGIYFITFTCYKWLPLIGLTKSTDLLYQWFDLLSTKGHSIVGYVIMPNHVHFMIYYYGGTQHLNTLVGNGKRFLAYTIIQRLTQTNQTNILYILQTGVTQQDRNRKKIHAVWEKSFDSKWCNTEKFILQKLNYMHQNPCTSKWKLSERSIEYPFSSASFYEIGRRHYPLIKDYRDVLVLLEN